MKKLCPNCKIKLDHYTNMFNEKTLNYRCKLCSKMYYYNYEINKMIEITSYNKEYNYLKNRTQC